MNISFGSIFTLLFHFFFVGLKSKFLILTYLDAVVCDDTFSDIGSVEETSCLVT